MRSTMLSLVAGAAMLLSACSSGSPTQAPAATTDNGGGGGGGTSPTQAPAATPDTGGGGGGGGGGGTGAYGSVHLDISGPVSKSADYDFVPAGSIFGGAQGSSLNFINSTSVEVVSILIGSDGAVVLSYGGQDFTVSAATCTTSNWNIGASSASGSFDCDASLIITAAGAQLTGGKVKGSFTAHA